MQQLPVALRRLWLVCIVCNKHHFHPLHLERFHCSPALATMHVRQIFARLKTDHHVMQLRQTVHPSIYWSCFMVDCSDALQLLQFPSLFVLASARQTQ